MPNNDKHIFVMILEKLIAKNYRTLRDVAIDFQEHLNIIVGDNECGKSTILEAINLGLSGQLNGRSIQNELHPFLFNRQTVTDFIESLKSASPKEPPKIIIELYLKDDPELVRLRGSINSLKRNCPGIVFSIEFDESFSQEYSEYIKTPETIRNIPIEYYGVYWRSFANDNITSRSIPVSSTLIDASTIRHNTGANKYILEIMKDYLQPEQRVQLSLSYRKMKDLFLSDDNVKKVNKILSDTKGSITDRTLSISLDSSSKSNWENGIETQLDEIPLSLAGKGEQNSIKIKLAMESADGANIFLIEEPENHLSFSNLNTLIKNISDKSTGKQLIITTHSSFVLNKLGIKNVILFGCDQKSITLGNLKSDTYDYFMKLPGHETLRLILSKKAILVEGPSDELIVQKAYLKKHNCMPLQNGVDVITVNSLAFKRFLEISAPLNIPTVVVTDNDGDLTSLSQKYDDFKNNTHIKICYDDDVACKTLEPQLLKANSLKTLNEIFGKNFATSNELLTYMTSNKTDCALAVFNTSQDINMPQYINKAVE